MQAFQQIFSITIVDIFKQTVYCYKFITRLVLTFLS